MNVFVIHSVALHIPLRTVSTGTRPFVCADLVRLAVLVAFPRTGAAAAKFDGVVTRLGRTMTGAAFKKRSAGQHPSGLGVLGSGALVVHRG